MKNHEASGKSKCHAGKLKRLKPEFPHTETQRGQEGEMKILNTEKHGRRLGVFNHG